MKPVILSFMFVLAVVFLVPVGVCAAFPAVTGLQPPGSSPAMFLLGVFISKAGMAAAFVLLLYFARNSWSGHCPRYAAIWWLMFAAGELGQAIGPDYG